MLKPLWVDASIRHTVRPRIGRKWKFVHFTLCENEKCLREHSCTLCALHVLAVASAGQACLSGHAGSEGFPVDTLVVVSAEYISAD